MTVQTFDGELGHKNPMCPKCNHHCYTIYSGGNKKRITGFFVCKKCNVVYQLPKQKSCEYSEVTA